MYIDARELDQGQHIEADICIIGAGAAGITIAREFIGTSTTVALLESGGFDIDEKTQSLYDGKNTGHPSFNLRRNRLRFFGGTTNHWAGHCRPLEPIDFEKRDWLEHSGWPITRSELEPFYRRAQPVVGLGPFEYDNLDFWQEKIKQPDLPVKETRLRTEVYNRSPPTRFGKEYRQELGDAKNIRVYLNANVLEILPNEAATQVTRLNVTCIDGPAFTVAARKFILATGGMENARLLLLSNSIAKNGLGNDRDLVGRFFMDHLLLRPGADISFSDPRLNVKLYDTVHKVAGGRMFAILASPEVLLRKEKLNNFRLHLLKTRPKAEHADGRVFSQLDAVPGAEEHVLDDLPERKENRDFVALHLVMEPTPNPNSRVLLSDSTDLLGQRKIDVDWRIRNKDLKHAHRAMELAAIEFGRMGLGRAYGEIFKDSSLWPDNMEAGKHHCGTTRMAGSPETGVVDKHCKVFNIDNLYLTGSSLFPTIGYANPTLTIVALALRLSDHLKGLPV